MTDVVEATRDHADYDSEAEAVRATEAVLVVLGTRLPRREAADVAAHLDDPAADWVVPDGNGPTPLAADEFVASVADRADADQDRAWTYAASVLGGLHDVVPDSEFRGVTARFPPEYDRLLVKA